MAEQKKVVRRLDPLGRIVLPKKFRKTLDLEIKDSVDIRVSGTSVIISKYDPGCIFCDSKEGLSVYKDNIVCEKCLIDLKNKNFF